MQIHVAGETKRERKRERGEGEGIENGAFAVWFPVQFRQDAVLMLPW